MPIPDVALTYELDAAWIIALWLAIHGGHPAPEIAAAEAIAALAPYLSGTQPCTLVFAAANAGCCFR
jgi:hypothetical protein